MVLEDPMLLAETALTVVVMENTITNSEERITLQDGENGVTVID